MQDTCAAVSKCACQYMTCKMLTEKNLNHKCKKLSIEYILCRHFVSTVERMFCLHVEHLRTLCRDITSDIHGLLPRFKTVFGTHHAFIYLFL